MFRRYGYSFGNPSGIPEGTTDSSQLGEYISAVPRYRDHDPGPSMFYMLPQDVGNSIVHSYKSLDG